MVIRKQAGIRLEPSLGAGFREVCRVQNVWPNKVIEGFMGKVVEAGSVDLLDGLFSSEGEELVRAVSIRKLLLQIDKLVYNGYWMIFRRQEAGNLLPDEQNRQAPYPELAPAIEKTIEQLLPRLNRVHDKALKGSRPTSETLKSRLMLTTTMPRTSSSNPRLHGNVERNISSIKKSPSRYNLANIQW